MTDAAFCSLTGARTFIDSNLAHVNTIFAANVPKYLMAGAAVGIPVEDLGDVLHEAVHHWCFNTPVGIALTYLRAELMEFAVTGRDHETVESYARYEAATKALRPIFEGIACFAEFDAYPGAGNMRAEPLTWLGTLAYPADAFDSDTRYGTDPEPLIRRMLATYRRLGSTAKRKDNLLSQPLDPTEEGGYLTGYLLVKGFQSRARSVSPLADDGELWICYLRAWLLHDLELANLLMRPPDPENNSTGSRSILARVTMRLESLRDATAVALSLAAFNETKSSTFSGSTQEFNDYALRMTSSDRDEVATLVDRHETRLGTPSDDFRIAVVRSVTTGVLANREWICVASAPGDISARVDGSCRFIDDEGLPRFATGPKTLTQFPFSDYAGPGALELWMGPLSAGAVMLVTSQSGVHAWVDMWADGAGSTEAFVSSARSNSYLLKSTAVIRSDIDAILRGQPWWDPVYDAVHEVVDAALIHQSHLAVELYGGTDEQVRKLNEEGFSPIFRSLRLLERVSAVGLLRSIGSDAMPDEQEFLASDDLLLQISVDGLLSGLVLTNREETELYI